MAGTITLCTIYRKTYQKEWIFGSIGQAISFLDKAAYTQNKTFLTSPLLLTSLLTNAWTLAPLFFTTEIEYN